MKWIIALSAGLIITLACECQTNHALTREKIKLLQPFAGNWSAEVKLHARDGRTFYESGTYQVSWILDSTYLQWHAYLNSKSNSKRIRNFMILMTYNPDSANYENLYIYRGSPMKVFEKGNFDPANMQYITTAFIPLEDGVHDEHVRTITKISGDHNHISYVHYSRYSNESAEILDFEAELKRME